MNNIKLAWDNDCDTCYDSRLDFTIPGYSFDHDTSMVQVYRPADWYSDKGWVYADKWTCHFYLDGMQNGAAGAAHLSNSDFDIPDTETADEMKQALERLTGEDVARALAEHGYKPDLE